MAAPETLKNGTSFQGPGSCQNPIASFRAMAKMAKAAASIAISHNGPGESAISWRQSAKPAAPRNAAALQACPVSDAQTAAATSAAPATAKTTERLGVFAANLGIEGRLRR